MEKKDVFISHAGEDKETYVRAIVDALCSLGISYWLDEAEIRWGDSIVEKINNGLRKSSFVIILITETFMAKKWPVRELNAALSMEINSGEKKVLPILAAPRETFFEQFPLLSDKLYLNWRDSPQYIARELLKLLKREYKTEWVHSHESSWSGKVWVRITPNPQTPENIYNYRLTWGAWRYDGTLAFENRSPVSLWHTKGNDGMSFPLSFHIEPPCFVTFGTGEPPDANPVGLHSNWTHTDRAGNKVIKRFTEISGHIAQSLGIKNRTHEKPPNNVIPTEKVNRQIPVNSPSSNASTPVKTSILFLSGSPADTKTPLRWGAEFREIQQILKSSKYSDLFTLIPQLSVRPEDISIALLREKPRIVHFSGHGAPDGSLEIENVLGLGHWISPDALAGLFSEFRDSLHCVVLNACFSEPQAQAIARDIPYVIGMQRQITDNAALAFSCGFYQSLSTGHDIEKSFNMGCRLVQLKNLPGSLTPVLYKCPHL